MKLKTKIGKICLVIGIGMMMLSCNKTELQDNTSVQSKIENPTSNGLENSFIPSELIAHSKTKLSLRSGGTYNIAFVSDLTNSSAYRVVNKVVTDNSLGTVTELTEQDVINGDLLTGEYDLFFIGRIYPGSGTNPTITADGFREELELALSNCIGMVTEWQGGSPFWTNLGTQSSYFQILDDDSSLYGWFDGTVDRGDAGWSSNTQLNANSGHPVMQGIPETFTLCGTEYFYRIQNPDPSLDILATVDSDGTSYPVLMAGQYQGTNAVLWPADWGDCGDYYEDLVRDQLIENAICYAGAPCDADGDGCNDLVDPHPNSNMEATVIIDGCDSGVDNVFVSEDGCSTMSDLIADAAAAATNHGEFVSAVSALTNGWKKAGIITGKEKGKIVSCAAQSNLPL